MRSTMLVGALVLAGCGSVDGPVLSEEAGLDGVRLVPFESGSGWGFRLDNGGSEVLTVGCEGGFCETPVLRHEALQVDGSWVERATWVRSRSLFDRPIEVAPGQAVDLFADGPLRSDMEVTPGTYRAVAHAVDPAGQPVEVSVEYAVTGWSSDDFQAAEEIRRQAETHSCRGVRREIDHRLLERLEPDALIDMHRARTGGGRMKVQDVMLHSGGYVAYLSHDLALAPLDEVRPAARFLARSPDPVQEPLRGLVAQRLLDFALGGELLAMDYSDLEALSPHWPDEAAPELVTLLESSPESDPAIITALIDLLTYVDRSRVEGLEERILAALPARCEGASNAELFVACRRATQRFTPGFHGGFGRGFGVSVSCGGALSLSVSPVCRALYHELDALSARAGDVELIWLGDTL